MAESTFTFRVDETLKQAFSQTAKANDRNGAQLIRDFMRDYIRHQQDTAEYDAWYRAQVQAGLDSANNGRLIDDAEVEAEFSERRIASGRKRDSAA